MKIAIVGSRKIVVTDFSKYVTDRDEIISGGAAGVDHCAADYAKKNGIRLTEILPEYARLGRAAPIIRNKQIVDLADKVVAFWDGHSRGTLSVINYAEKTGKACEIVVCK